VADEVEASAQSGALSERARAASIFERRGAHATRVAVEGFPYRRDIVGRRVDESQDAVAGRAVKGASIAQHGLGARWRPSLPR
jgi:hypothetical protein